MKDAFERIVHKNAKHLDYVIIAVAFVVMYAVLRVVLSVTGVVLGLAMDIIIHILPLLVVAVAVIYVLKKGDKDGER